MEIGVAFAHESFAGPGGVMQFETAEPSMETLSTFQELTVKTPVEPIRKPNLTWKLAFA